MQQMASPGRWRAEDPQDPQAAHSEKQRPPVGRDSCLQPAGRWNPAADKCMHVAGEQPRLQFTGKLLLVTRRRQLIMTLEQGTETPALRKLPHRDCQFKACLGYKVRLFQ